MLQIGKAKDLSAPLRMLHCIYTYQSVIRAHKIDRILSRFEEPQRGSLGALVQIHLREGVKKVKGLKVREKWDGKQ
jgi:hypothetical protein